MKKQHHNTIALAARASIICAMIAAVSFSAGARNASAYSIEQLTSVSASNDFVVSPGKAEMSLAPGQSKTVNVVVLNRMAETRTFDIGVEDIAGSEDAAVPVTLLGTEAGAYSLKKNVSPDTKSVTLKHGEQATIPVTVTIPANAEPGGEYGSVVVSTLSAPTSQGSAGQGGSGTAVVSRIGVLFFVTVPGDVKTAGDLKSFETKAKQALFENGPIDFQLLYENTGSIHLNPYGEIDVANVFGTHIAKVIVDPWFALPASLRLREAQFDQDGLFGIYRATAKINRGYGDIVDEKSLTFVVLPVREVAGIIAALIVLIVIAKAVMKRRRKTVVSSK